jgi:hypothetical protein
MEGAAMKRYVFFLLSIFIATAVQGQDFTTSETEKTAFISNAISQLSTKAYPSQVENIKAQVTKWKISGNEEDWIEVTDAVYKVSKKSDSKSEVTISTSNGDGAKIKYQTLGQRKRDERPTTAKGLTVTMEKMYIGMYHIWSERKGESTSSEDDQFDIAERKVEVTLQEDK